MLCAPTRSLPRKDQLGKRAGPIVRECRLTSLRAYMAAKYVPRSRSAKLCERCGVEIPPSRSGRLRRWCDQWRLRRDSERRYRPTERPCHRCSNLVSVPQGKPGKTVCDQCRREGRDRRDHERPHAQKYGLGRWVGCLTDQPGGADWSVDHCHVFGACARRRLLELQSSNGARGR